MGNDKFDIELWKELQDNFSEKLGIPILSFAKDGEKIVFSGKLPFYLELIQSKKPEFLNRPTGCKFIKKPLILYGEQVGEILLGPLGFSSDFDIKVLADALGIDEEEMRYASKSINEVDSKSEYNEKVLEIFADMIPSLAYQHNKKEKRIMELTALYKIIRKANSTLELDAVLKYIMNFLVNTLDATDCSVFVYNQDGEKKYCLNEEAQKMAEIEKMISRKAIDDKKMMIARDINEKFNLNVDEKYNSILSLPLMIKEEVIGTVNIYGSSIGEISDDSAEFLAVIADQVAAAVSNASKFEQFKELAVVDKLTNVFNRRYFMELLERAVNEEISAENPIGLVLLDVDSFGKYNNTHGHPKGDDLLVELSRIIKSKIRKGDIVGRYGGEEFIIMMPKATPQSALEVANGIKDAVAEYKFYGRETQPNGRVTVSIGLVVCRANIKIQELLKDVDEAMYKAKNSGKNRVVQKVILSNNLKAEI